jgi:hypothetical protein
MFCSLASVVWLAGTVTAQVVAAPPLFQLANVKGSCEVKRPAQEAREQAINRKAYPFGTSVFTGLGGKAVVMIDAGPEVASASAMLAENTEVHIDRNPEIASNSVMRLITGSTEVFAETDTPAHVLAVDTANFVVNNFTGRATLSLKEDSEFQTVEINVVKGGVALEGDQFAIPAMRAGSRFTIETTPDRSLSRITCIKGEVDVALQNGSEEPLSFPARPGAIIKIWRQFAPVGGRQIVAVFAVGPDGKRPECYAFAVGLPGIVSVDTAEETAAAAAAGDFDDAAAAFSAFADDNAAPDGGKSSEEVDQAYKELFGDLF